MKDEWKMIVLRVVTGIVVFAGAFAWFNYRDLNRRGNVAGEMANPSYPVLEIQNEEGDYNRMAGYRDPIDVSLVRNQVTVVDSSREIALKLYHFGYDITAIQYVLYQTTPDEPIEEGTVSRLEDTESTNVREGSFRLESDFHNKGNYYLQLAVRLNNNTRIFFYTKVQYAEGCHLEDYLTFVRTFHNNLFEEGGMDKNAVYLEPVETAVENTLEYVTIKSSVKSVFFGGITMKEENEPQIRVEELNGTYGVLRMDTLVSGVMRGNKIQYYDMRETFKVRYTTERIYLLDYQRTMDAYYNEELIDSSDNMITLGIQNRNNIDYRYSDEGKKVAFAQNGQLWYYNYQSSDVARIFSFPSDNMGDIRNDPSCHGLKILDFDKKGNVTYLAYGYFNRGHHEGKNGILIMHYDAAANCSSEIAFLASSVPFESLKEDISSFAYLNSKKIFYCKLDGDFHRIDLNSRKDKIIQSGLIQSNLTASADRSLISIEENRNLSRNKKIRLINLETGKEKVFEAEAGERIKAVGFLTNDFIYGAADADNIQKDTDGSLLFPMYILHIVDSSGAKVKDYKKKNRYVMETRIKGAVLQMTLGKKENNRFKTIDEDDFIRYKEDNKKDEVTLSYKYSNTYRNQLYLKFPEYVYIQIAPDLVLTHFSVDEDDRTITLKKSGDVTKQYMVYAAGKKQGTYTSLSDAIAAADETRGNVIDSQEKTVWQCIFPEYGIVAGMDHVIKAGSKRRSLEACLAMIAAHNGKNRSIESIYASSGTIEERIKDCSGYPAINLTGCSVDEVLYYISEGMPVLARYSDRRYVIVMSYNATKLRYLDPVTGLSTATGRAELTSKLEDAGNEFYSYWKSE